LLIEFHDVFHIQITERRPNDYLANEFHVVTHGLDRVHFVAHGSPRKRAAADVAPAIQEHTWAFPLKDFDAEGNLRRRNNIHSTSIIRGSEKAKRKERI
jgi:hypothetical protein